MIHITYITNTLKTIFEAMKNIFYTIFYMHISKRLINYIKKTKKGFERKHVKRTKIFLKINKKKDKKGTKANIKLSMKKKKKKRVNIIMIEILK